MSAVKRFFLLSMASVLVAMGVEARGEDRSLQISADPEYASGLIRSFNAFCPSNGAWTTNALAQSQKIRKVLESLRDDPGCSDAAASVAVHVDNLGLALGRMEDTQIERDILGRQKQQMVILSFLEEQNSSDQRQSLEELFRENQLTLSMDRESLRFNEDIARNRYLANSVMNSATHIFQQVTLNRRCLFQSPQFLSGLSSIGTSLGSALLTGGVSLGVAATSHILGHTLEFIRKAKLDRSIQKLGQGEFVSAYQCVLRSLSSQWCEARETYDLLELKMGGGEVEKDIFSQGLGLLQHDLPVLLDWLGKVHSATEAENPETAAKQIEFLNMETKLKTWKISSLALITETARDKLPKSLLGEESKVEQYNVLKELVETLVQVAGGAPRMGSFFGSSREEVKNPIFEIIDRGLVYWKLAGIPEEKFPFERSFSGTVVPLEFAKTNHKAFLEREDLRPYYPLDPQKMRESVLDLYLKAKARLVEQRVHILNIDPQGLLASAQDDTYSGVSHVKNLSPLDATKNILGFLESAYGTGLPSCNKFDVVEHENDFGKLHSETQSILCEIKRQMTEDPSVDYRDRLKVIFTEAHLEDGEEFMSGRLQDIIRRILLEYLGDDEHSLESRPLRYKLLLADEVVRELERYNDSNLADISDDILQALQFIEDTLQGFGEIFAESLGKTVAQVHQKHSGDDLSGPLLDKYCSLLLTIPNWDSPKLKRHVDLSLCEGRGLQSRWKIGQEEGKVFEFTFSEDVYRSEFGRRRMCHFRRFRRKEKFYQSYAQ